MADEERFAQIVSIGAHDLSTPLATVYGFAKTLAKTDLDEPAARYVEMIEAASAQLRDLVEELSLVTRIERGRYSPALTDADSLELAAAHHEGDRVDAAMARSGFGETGDCPARRLGVHLHRRALPAHLHALSELGAGLAGELEGIRAGQSRRVAAALDPGHEGELLDEIAELA